jgi:2-amino-4-hydroxy-6-hydroxymethyldihydropteridine diphosphokinase
MEGRERLPEVDEPDRPRIGSVYLSLGSNLGDRVRNLERALERLRAHLYMEAISSIYETQPVGVRDQPWFLNLVCVATTRLKPRALLEYVHEIEAALGRERGERFGPRTIDIDVLAYDDHVVDEPDLSLPHARMHERRFVLEPLAEIAPDWRHPVSGRSAGELLAELDDDEVRVVAAPPPLSGPSPIL